MNVHFSSKTDDWYTPQDFFWSIEHEFGPFDVDVCATKENTKCKVFFSPEEDGLKQDWSGKVCWMNPPYGRQIGKWIEKAATGGGADCRGAPSCPYRHEDVAHVHSREGRGALRQRTPQVRREQRRGTVPERSRHF